MEQNKVRTYLLYAVGEILLVVIGILIALQVNNWNEERKLNQERITLLNALKLDYETSITDSEEQMGEAEKRSRLLKQLLAYSAGESIDVTDDSLKTMLQESLLFFFSREFSTTYEQAKSSGKLSLIQNQNLLRALSDNEENIKGLIIANDKLPVFDESFSDFNIKIEILSVFDRLGNFEWAPENHPQLTLSGENLHEYLRSPETYTRLHNIYYVNNIMNLWWKSINYSTGVVLEEIDISLNQI